MLCLIQFGLQELLAVLVVIGIVVAALAVAWYTLRNQKRTVKSDAIQDLNDVVEAQSLKIQLLNDGLTSCRAEHEKCERKINLITAFNLRLQAREGLYQKTINRLEARSGLEQTDFSNVSHALEDSDFG